MVCGIIGRKLGAKHVIARIRDPQYLHQEHFLREALGLSQIVNPEYECAKEISRILRFPGASRVDSFSKGSVEIAEHKITEKSVLTGLALKDLSTRFGAKILIALVERNGSAIIPNGNTILKAVDEHAGLLRQSAAVPGNDHRLGAAEAPPAIISVFLGEQLEDVIHQLIDTGAAAHSKPGGVLKTGVNTMVEVAKDATDRNRTSPFAFTGNKFEFRMVGSSASISNANVVLNTIAAEAFRDVADELEKAEDFSLAVHDMIKKLFTEHQRVIFSGNGYSAEWVKEAERRGLPHYRSSIESVVELTSESSVKMFRDFGVYTKSELESRAEIEYETYAKTINIEAKAMLNIAGKQIIPAVVKYTTRLAESINAVRTACPEACVNSQMELLKNTSRLLEEMRMALHRLREANFKAAGIDDMKERAMFYLNVVVPEMQAFRTPADKLEMLCDKDLWPFPSYGDMLFEI